MNIQKRILIVENNVAKEGRPMQDILKQDGFEVIDDIARTVQEAVHLAGRHQPDLVLLDIMIPEKPNQKDHMEGGIIAAHTIKQVCKAKIVYVTGARITDHLLLEAQKTHPFDFLTKPWERGQLLTTVKRALLEKHPLFEPPVDFVIITAMKEERESIGKLLGARKLPPSNDDIRFYHAAGLDTHFSDGEAATYRVVLTQLLNMGRVQAATATSDAIKKWNPRYVVLIGIAGGVAKNGVKLGDVLVSDQIVDYEVQKVTPDAIRTRWEVHRADPRMLGATQNISNEDYISWIAAEPPTKEGKPQVHWGPIATGDKVIAAMQLLKQKEQIWDKLIGVEMEAGGVATAAFQAVSKPGFFMIRGVSDLADENKNTSQVLQWREYACDVAAAYTFSLLSNGPVPVR